MILNGPNSPARGGIHSGRNPKIVRERGASERMRSPVSFQRRRTSAWRTCWQARLHRVAYRPGRQPKRQYPGEARTWWPLAAQRSRLAEGPRRRRGAGPCRRRCSLPLGTPGHDFWQKPAGKQRSAGRQRGIACSSSERGPAWMRTSRAASGRREAPNPWILISLVEALKSASRVTDPALNFHASAAVTASTKLMPKRFLKSVGISATSGSEG